MLLAAVGIYIFVTLAVGAYAARLVKNSQDYVLAGRRLPLYLAGAALFATWFGSETLMGASSEFAENGVLGVIEDPFGASLCLILVGAFFARPLYRMKLLTLGDFYRNRFGRNAEIVSSVFMIPSYFGWIAAQFVAMGIVLHSLTGWGVDLCIGLGALIVLVYTYLGGMWAISITDFIQTIVIVSGLVLLVLSLYLEIGAWEPVVQKLPEGFFNFLPGGDSMSILAYFSAWITIGWGSIPQQDVFQRVMSAKSEKIAVQASYLAGILYFTIAALPLLAVLLATHLYPNLQLSHPQMLLPQIVLLHSSPWLQIFFFGALLSAIMSTASGAILAPASVFAENIVRPMLQSKEDSSLLRNMRHSVLVIAAAAAWMGWSNNDIYDLVSQSSALSLVSLFAPLVGGLYWKRTSGAGALASMILGMCIWTGFHFIQTEWPPLIPATIGSFLGMVLFSFWFPDKSNSAEI